MNFPRQLVLATAAVCLFLLALVAAVVALMQLYSVDSDAPMSLGDRVAAILMVCLLACAMAGLALHEFYRRYVRASARLVFPPFRQNVAAERTTRHQTQQDQSGQGAAARNHHVPDVCFSRSASLGTVC